MATGESETWGCLVVAVYVMSLVVVEWVWEYVRAWNIRVLEYSNVRRIIRIGIWKSNMTIIQIIIRYSNIEY